MNDIVILGCGISGMLTALKLANAGLATTILERSALKERRDQRTIALTDFSKNFLDKIGLWNKLEPYVGKIKDIYVMDNKSPRMVHLESEGANCALGYMIEYVDLVRILLEATKASPLIELNTEVDYGTKFLNDLVVVCDGKNSKVRQEYFVDRASKSYGQSAMTFMVKHEKPHEGTAVEHFMTQGPFAILPLRDPHKSSIVWTEREGAAKLYVAMERDELTKHLLKRFGEFLGAIEIINMPQAFPLTARVTQKYYHENMVLVADSAHTIHPLAGQGLNQGIKDIEALTSIISRNLSVGLGVNQTALREYENKRKVDNYAMYLITDNLNRLFSHNFPVVSKIRKIGLGLVDGLSPLKSLIARYRGV